MVLLQIRVLLHVCLVVDSRKPLPRAPDFALNTDKRATRELYADFSNYSHA